MRVFAPYDILKEQILHETQLINKPKTYTIMDKKVMVTALTASVALMNIGSAATSIIDQTFFNDQTSVTGTKSSTCLLYTSPSPRDQRGSRMPSSA